MSPEGSPDTSPDHMGRFIHASDERTPLLATADAYPVACTEEEPGLLNGGALDSGNRGPLKGPALDDVNPNPEDAENKPLPKVQIFLLCYARLVEPIAFFSIFPFINKMIWENGKERGVGEGDVGFYSGLTVRLIFSSLHHDISFQSFSMISLRVWFSSQDHQLQAFEKSQRRAALFSPDRSVYMKQYSQTGIVTGIIIFTDSDATYDSLGASCRSLRQKTCLGILIVRRLYRHGIIWFKQDDLADDSFQMSGGSLCWHRSVSPTSYVQYDDTSGPIG